MGIFTSIFFEQLHESQFLLLYLWIRSTHVLLKESVPLRLDLRTHAKRRRSLRRNEDEWICVERKPNKCENDFAKEVESHNDLETMGGHSGITDRQTRPAWIRHYRTTSVDRCMLLSFVSPSH